MLILTYLTSDSTPAPAAGWCIIITHGSINIRYIIPDIPVVIGELQVGLCMVSMQGQINI